MTTPISFGKNSRLSIFHFNDLHGQTDNISSIYYASKKFDGLDDTHTDKIKLSGGDNVCGADEKRNRIIANMLDIMKIDASSVGNHEFDNSATGLSKFLNSTKTKFLSSNLDIPSGHALNDAIQKSIIKEINGTKYGIIGVTTPELPTSIKSPKLLEGVQIQELNETIKTVQEEVDKLKKDGIERIILLPHAGYEVDKIIAKNTSGIDVIVSGHSHDIIENVKSGENYVYSKAGEPVLIIQAGDNGRYYGVCDIEFDSNGIVKKANNNVYKTENKKNSLINHLINSVLGKSPIIANVTETIENPKNRRIEPNGWTNLIADSVINEMNVDITLINGANVRKVPPLGNLTERTVSETTPYKNDLVKTQISERELVNALKFACNSLKSESGNPGLLIPGGLRYEVQKDGELKNLKFIDKQGTEHNIDINNPTDKMYSIVIDVFLFENEEYKPLNLKRDFEKFRFDKDKTAIDYIKKLTKNGEPLKIKDDGRVKILETSQNQFQNNNKQNFLGLTSIRNS